MRITKQKGTFLTAAMLICCNTLLMLFCNILLEIRAEDKFTPEVDVSIYSKSDINILDYLNRHIDIQNDFECYAQGHLYTVPEAKISIPKLSEKYVPQFMKLSDYNEINTMQGKNHINLNNDKYLLIENIMCKYWTGDLNFVTEVQTFLQNNTEIEINSVKLFPFNIEQNIEMFDFQCARNNVRFTDYVVVIPDYVIADDCPCVSTFKAIYKDNKKEIEEQIVNSLFETYNGQANVTLYTNEKEQIITTTAKFFEENIKFSHLHMIYFMSYVGITGIIVALSIFVIMSILEVVQNTDNYKTLLKLGVPAKSVKSSVFKQVTSYFFILSEFVMINVIYSFLLFSKHKTLFNQAKILPYVFGKTFAPILLLLVISYIMVVSVCRRIVNKSILQSDNYCE